MFKDKPIQNGGYHFTSVGNLEAIRNKIDSWGHQEFDNRFTLSQLEKNVQTGQDIFNRETGTILNRIDINNSDLFDPEIRKLLISFPQFISSLPIKHIKF